MNSAQFNYIRYRFDIYKALYEASEERYEDWDTMTKKDLMKEVMVRTKGRCNPAIVEKIIDEL